MKYKKAVSIPEMFALVIAAIAFLVIFIPIGNYVAGLLSTTPDQEVTDSAEVFVTELNALHYDAQEYVGTGARINLGLITQEKFSFQAYNPKADPPDDCFTYSCLCTGLIKKTGKFESADCFILNENARFNRDLIFIQGTGKIVSVTATAKQDPVKKEKTIITLDPRYI